MILGVGFNQESLHPDAIAISSNVYQTTNKGVNNIEIGAEEEFSSTSAPCSQILTHNPCTGQFSICPQASGSIFTAIIIPLKILT